MTWWFHKFRSKNVNISYSVFRDFCLCAVLFSLDWIHHETSVLDSTQRTYPSCTRFWVSLALCTGWRKCRYWRYDSGWKWSFRWSKPWGEKCLWMYVLNSEAYWHFGNLLIEFQLELSVFRAQWMSELKPSSGASGTSHRLLQAKGLKRTQEIAQEEKVSCEIISSSWSQLLHTLCSAVTDIYCWLMWFIFPQATELFLRAVQEEQNGAVYEGVYAAYTMIKIMREIMKLNQKAIFNS